jgi:hypothetical protein
LGQERLLILKTYLFKLPNFTPTKYLLVGLMLLNGAQRCRMASKMMMADLVVILLLLLLLLLLLSLFKQCQLLLELKKIAGEIKRFSQNI